MFGVKEDCVWHNDKKSFGNKTQIAGLPCPNKDMEGNCPDGKCPKFLDKSEFEDD